MVHSIWGAQYLGFLLYPTVHVLKSFLAMFAFKLFMIDRIFCFLSPLAIFLTFLFLNISYFFHNLWLFIFLILFLAF